jgi:hypothetical protein
MSDPTPEAPPVKEESAPKGPEAPATGPLTPVFLVWPGRNFSQTWVLFWLGIAYVISALLPWHGDGATRCILADGRDTTLAVHRHETMLHEHNEAVYPQPADIVSTEAPGMGFGALVVLIFGLGMALSGTVNIWNRRLVLWPTTLCWVMAFLALYFTRAAIPAKGLENAQHVGLFDQLGELASRLGDLFKDRSSVEYVELSGIAGRFGLGYYLGAMVEAALVVFIIGSLIVGIMHAKKAPPPARPATGGARRPGGRR